MDTTHEPTTDEWSEKMWSIYTMEYYSATKTNDTGFEGKWMQLEHIMLSEGSQAQKDKRPHVFSHTWKTDPKDKCIHKNKHDCIQTQM
jgi:hypothetical protein